ncbi:hypothetical protein [Nostoc sp. CCY0012]|uniref:hypothetical protein n=1 Tax=Nostoc sp. CCY0012 TaxID=1056123 RepID=UPI0039C60EAE
MSKNKNLSLMIAAFILMGLSTAPINALEQRQYPDIPIDELVKETMQFAALGTEQMNVVWYLPLEMFGAPPQPVLIIAVVKAKIISPDSYKFASEAETQRGLTVTYTNSSGKSINLVPASKNSDVDLFIKEIKPFMSQFAGKFGEGIWFFTYQNVDDAGKKIVSPYELGKLNVSFNGKSATPQPESTIEFPLNSLFVPRICPNGKPAHISWKYCPWDGTPLSNTIKN